MLIGYPQKKIGKINGGHITFNCDTKIANNKGDGIMLIYKQMGSFIFLSEGDKGKDG
jgi:hypothetical protein